MRPRKYSKENIIIHWLTALFIAILFPLGNMLEDFNGTTRLVLLIVHIVLGIAVLFLTLTRSWLTLKRPQPTPVDTGSKFNNGLVKWVHRAFYFLLLAISISGIATVFAGQYYRAIATQNPDVLTSNHELALLEYHDFFSQILILLLILHVVGVAKHYILKKENTLKRMW